MEQCSAKVNPEKFTPYQTDIRRLFIGCIPHLIKLVNPYEKLPEDQSLRGFYPDLFP